MQEPEWIQYDRISSDVIWLMSCVHVLVFVCVWVCAHPGWNAFLPEGEVNVAVGYQEVVNKLLPKYGGFLLGRCMVSGMFVANVTQWRSRCRFSMETAHGRAQAHVRGFVQQPAFWGPPRRPLCAHHFGQIHEAWRMPEKTFSCVSGSNERLVRLCSIRQLRQFRRLLPLFFGIPGGASRMNACDGHQHPAALLARGSAAESAF